MEATPVTLDIQGVRAYRSGQNVRDLEELYLPGSFVSTVAPQHTIHYWLVIERECTMVSQVKVHVVLCKTSFTTPYPIRSDDQIYIWLASAPT